MLRFAEPCAAIIKAANHNNLIRSARHSFYKARATILSRYTEQFLESTRQNCEQTHVAVLVKRAHRTEKVFIIFFKCLQSVTIFHKKTLFLSCGQFHFHVVFCAPTSYELLHFIFAVIFWSSLIQPYLRRFTIWTFRSRGIRLNVVRKNVKKTDGKLKLGAVTLTR